MKTLWCVFVFMDILCSRLKKHSVIKLPEIGEKDYMFSAYMLSQKHVDSIWKTKSLLWSNWISGWRCLIFRQLFRWDRQITMSHWWCWWEVPSVVVTVAQHWQKMIYNSLPTWTLIILFTISEQNCSIIDWDRKIPHVKYNAFQMTPDCSVLENKNICYYFVWSGWRDALIVN